MNAERRTEELFPVHHSASRAQRLILLLVLVVVGVLAELYLRAAGAGDGVALLVEGHAEVEPHAVQDFLYLVERLLAEVLRREHLALAPLHEVADNADVGV